MDLETLGFWPIVPKTPWTSTMRKIVEYGKSNSIHLPWLQKPNSNKRELMEFKMDLTIQWGLFEANPQQYSKYKGVMK